MLGPVSNLTDFDVLRRQPTVYALAHNGAETLSGIDRFQLDHIDWKLKNRRLGSYHVHHALDIADFVIAFLGDTKDYGLGLIDHHDLLPYLPPTTRDQTCSLFPSA